MNCRFTVHFSTSFSTISFCIEIPSPCLGCHAFPPNQPPELTATMSPPYCFQSSINVSGSKKTKDEGVLRCNLNFFTPVRGHDIRNAFHFL